jgi:hypothetical protein
LKDVQTADAPAPFARQVEFTFTYRAILSRNTTVAFPMELVSVRPTAIAPITPKNVLRPDRQWETAAMTIGWLDKSKEMDIRPKLQYVLNSIAKEEADFRAARLGKIKTIPKSQWRKVRSTDGLKELDDLSIDQARRLCDIGDGIKLGKNLNPADANVVVSPIATLQFDDAFQMYAR